MNPDGLWKQVQGRVKLAADFAQGVAYDLKVEADEALRTGLGVPRAATDIASFACYAVAAAGTVSMAGDFIGKVWGTRECDRCNGWEGIACCTCKGHGRVQFAVRNSNLRPGEKETVGNVALAVAEGRSDVLHLPVGMTYGPFPRKECPTCTGAGVMKCPLCKGNAWKPKISFDKIFDAPWKTWDVYRKSRRVGVEDLTMGDPNLARYWMFVRPELETGIKIPEETKKQMWWDYERSQEYNKVRQLVAKRGPGWEEAQKTLVELQPNRALSDPVIVHNVPYFKALKQTGEEVMKLRVPSRPADWGEQAEISEVEEFEKMDPKAKEALEDVLETKKRVTNVVLENAWAREWRQKKVEEIMNQKAVKIQEMAMASSLAENKTQSTTQEGKGKEVSSEKGKNSAKGKGTATEAKKKISEEERKKKEREERRARMAKQAAEREAALSEGRTT